MTNKVVPVQRKAKAIGQRIKGLREMLGLSQREVAQPGCSYAYLSRIEAGTRNVSYEALVGIADKLDTTGLFLLTGNEDAPCPFCRRDAPLETL